MGFYITACQLSFVSEVPYKIQVDANNYIKSETTRIFFYLTLLLSLTSKISLKPRTGVGLVPEVRHPPVQAGLQQDRKGQVPPEQAAPCHRLLQQHHPRVRPRQEALRRAIERPPQHCDVTVVPER